MTQVVKPNASEYGIEENKAKQVEELFLPMLSKMKELEEEYNALVSIEVTPEVVKKAKELRLKLVKVRTETAKIHKKEKAFFLAGGRLIDDWKNTQLAAAFGKEDKLKDIENHYINIEKERIAKLQNERANILLSYDADSIPKTLGSMSVEMWEAFHLGIKTSHENKLEAEKKAEEERIEAERLAEAARIKAEEERKAEQLRLKKENERLRKESEAKAKQDEAERAKREKAEAERKAKEAEAEKKRQEERKAAEAKVKKERELQEAAIRKEKAEKKRLADELAAKKKEEEEQERQRLATIQAELNKGDSEKVNDLIDMLKSLKTKYKFESEANQQMYKDVGLLIDKVTGHIEKIRGKVPEPA